MAKATTRFVEETVTTVVNKEDGVLLELSKEEADVLAAILGPVGGCPTNSPRRVRDLIADVLRDAGYCWSTSRSYKSLSGSVYFKDTP